MTCTNIKRIKCKSIVIILSTKQMANIKSQNLTGSPHLTSTHSSHCSMAPNESTYMPLHNSRLQSWIANKNICNSFKHFQVTEFTLLHFPIEFSDSIKTSAQPINTNAAACCQSIQSRSLGGRFHNLQSLFLFQTTTIINSCAFFSPFRFSPEYSNHFAWCFLPGKTEEQKTR